MREIKFRVYSEHRKKWIFSGTSPADIANFFDLIASGAANINKLCQYAGLKDKNGKEIYEGDIIKVDCQPSMFIEIKWDNKKTKFDTDSSYWKLEPEQLPFYEIIGNIYSDSELMEEKK